jgi:uncharacterized protein (TIGR02145 family)
MKRLITISIVLLNFSSIGAQYGAETGTVSDIDGNIYKTVVIGNYIWMAENLRTTTYNNGEVIPFVKGNSNWYGLTSDAYCWYDDNIEYSNSYGALYNWYAVNTGRICPEGWRVPSDEDWKYLEGYADSIYDIGNPVWDKSGLRGYNAGTRLRSTTGWRAGGNGTNEFGFSALPAGERLNGFNNMGGSNGFWWSCTEADSLTGWYRSIIYSFAEVSRDRHPKKMGFSVRCLREK